MREHKVVQVVRPRIRWPSQNRIFAILGAAVHLGFRAQNGGPVFRSRKFGQVLHQASGDQIIRIFAGVQSGRTHRVATQKPADDDRAGYIALPCDCAINPLVAGRVKRLGEFGHGHRFTARCPPAGVRLRTGRTHIIPLVMSAEPDVMNHTAN